ncbi:hypothetical protein [Dactylosporangium cerinum]
MSRQRRRDTAPELAIRRVLHARGMRYRVDAVLPGTRRRGDIVFPGGVWRSSSTAASGTGVRSMAPHRSGTPSGGPRSCRRTSTGTVTPTPGSHRSGGLCCVSGNTSRP